MNLPPSRDKFWKLAETNKYDIVVKKCSHDFRQTSGTEFTCRKCNAGLISHGLTREQVFGASSGELDK